MSNYVMYYITYEESNEKCVMYYFGVMTQILLINHSLGQHKAHSALLF